MDMEEWLRNTVRERNNRAWWSPTALLVNTVRALARKPTMTLFGVTLGAVLLLPFVAHYAIMIILVLFSHVGLLRIHDDKETLTWILTAGQIFAVLLTFLFTATLLLVWYMGMRNIYIKYFKTHKREALATMQHNSTPICYKTN